MNPKTNKVLLVTALAVFAGAAWFAWRTARMRENALQTLASVQKSRDGMKEQFAQAERRRAVVETEHQAALAELDRARTAARQKTAALAGTRPQQSPQSSNGGQDWRKVVVGNPRLESLFLSTTRDRISAEHALLYAQYGLSPGQIAKFEAAMMKMQETELDLYAVMQSADPQTRETARELGRKAREENAAVMRELFGESGPKLVRDYARMGGARNSVSEMAGAAALAGVPFSAEQAQQLCDAIAAATPVFAKGGSVDARTTDWEQVDVRAAQILSPTQLQAAYRRGARANAEIQSAVLKALEAEGLSLKTGSP